MKTNSWTLKLTILLVSSLTIMSVITISPSLPEMKEAFSAHSNADFLVKLILTLPALFIALSAGIIGILIDRYGRLRFLWIAMVFYAIGGTAGFWLDNIYYILTSRAILGIAVGITMTIVTTLVADYFVGNERQKFVGLQIAFMSMGGILFLGLGGVLADIDWKYPFLIYSFSLLIVPLVLLFLHEPERINSQPQEIAGLKSPKIIWLLFINTMVMWIIFFMIPVQIPFYLKAFGIEKNALIGLAIAISTAFSAISSFSYSKFKDRLSFFTIFAIGYFLMAVAYAVLAWADNYGMVVVSMMLAGFGIGMMIPNTNIWVMKIAPAEIRGKEIGKLTTFWFMGQFLSPIIILPLSQSVSLSSMFMIAAVFLFALFLFFLLMNFLKSETGV